MGSLNGVGGASGMSMGFPCCSYAIRNNFSVLRIVSRNSAVRSLVMWGVCTTEKFSCSWNVQICSENCKLPRCLDIRRPTVQSMMSMGCVCPGRGMRVVSKRSTTPTELKPSGDRLWNGYVGKKHPPRRGSVCSTSCAAWLASSVHCTASRAIGPCRQVCEPD